MNDSNILAIDIGGTKTATALCHISADRVTKTSHHKAWKSRESKSFAHIAAEIVEHYKGGPSFSAVGIGLAGPVGGLFPGQTAHATNLDWTLDAPTLSTIFGNVPVFLCNDMESHGWGLLSLTVSQTAILNPGSPAPGCRALIAAGTGLGESVIAWDGSRHIPLGGEGGHSAFSPSDARDDELLVFLRRKLNGGHVSWERALGGFFGFCNLANFLGTRTSDAHKDFDELKRQVGSSEDWGPSVIELAAKNQHLACEILSYYALLYGREAANLAVKCMPYNGVYVGGGIAPRILPWLEKHFMTGFLDKGRFADILKKIPVHVILEPENGLRGAAAGAWNQLRHFNAGE